MDLLAAVLQAMRREHQKALAALDVGDKLGRIFLTGGGADLVRRLLPEYSGQAVELQGWRIPLQDC